MSRTARSLASTYLAATTAFLSLVFGYYFFFTIHADFPPAGTDGPGRFWPQPHAQ